MKKSLIKNFIFVHCNTIKEISRFVDTSREVGKYKKEYTKMGKQ